MTSLWESAHWMCRNFLRSPHYIEKNEIKNYETYGHALTENVMLNSFSGPMMYPMNQYTSSISGS